MKYNTLRIIRQLLKNELEGMEREMTVLNNDLKKLEEETKKPCTPVEEAGGDYNELGLYLHSKENNRTLEAAQTLWEFLPGWMAARKMAVYDPDYNRSLSGVIAENAEIILKAAQDMAGWGLAECEPARKEETPQG